MKTRGNTIMITGGGTGIGLALAVRFLVQQGNEVIICGRRLEKLNEGLSGNIRSCTSTSATCRRNPPGAICSRKSLIAKFSQAECADEQRRSVASHPTRSA